MLVIVYSCDEAHNENSYSVFISTWEDIERGFLLPVSSTKIELTKKLSSEHYIILECVSHTTATF